MIRPPIAGEFLLEARFGPFRGKLVGRIYLARVRGCQKRRRCWAPGGAGREVPAGNML